MLLLGRFRIVGHSMKPTFDPYDIVLASILPYFFQKPKPNDIVVFKDLQTGTIAIKRITKIENGKYFVVGDNKHDSIDSRKLGWIERKQIVGKVIFKIKVKN